MNINRNKIHSMKTKFKYILLTLAVGLVSLTSCDKFLDMTPVEQLTFAKIWEKRASSEAYLATVYGYMPNHHAANGREQAIFIATDESMASWPNAKGAGGAMTNGTWSPSSINFSGGANDDGEQGGFNVPWVPYYRGIREATIFINNIDKVPDNEIEPAKRNEYKLEARFLRAYYYCQLMRLYGPVVLIGEDLMDPTASQAQLSTPRNSWEECMTYVIGEMTALAADGMLPLSQPSTQYGRPTKGAALAAISRLTLYAARPLFNGNPLYTSIANKDGKRLFTQGYDINRWKVAADAAKAVIDLGIYELHAEGDDPYASLAGVFGKRWNSEVILGRNAGSANMAQHNTPRGGVEGWGGAYGGWGPTQQQVDAYAMNTGIYPVLGYTSDGQPKVDPKANYSENAWSSYEHPFDKITKNTNTMYQNREPRFYLSVFWNGQKWYQENGKDVGFNTGGNSGPPEQDHAKAGYLNRKFCPAENAPKNGVFMTFSWPYARLAEIYLNYVEALNEFAGPSNPDIKIYLNKIRKRAGVPDLEVVYPEAFASKETLREYILKERRLELAFEGHRFFDTRTWMLKVDGQYADAGPVYGMNIAATNSEPTGGFWKRVVTETRVFKDAFYLTPIAQSEMNKNHDLIQNYGW